MTDTNPKEPKVPVPNSPSPVRRILSVLIPLVLAVVLFAVVYRDFSVEDFKRSISETNTWLLVLSVIPLGFSHYLRGVRWNALIKSAGYHATDLELFAAVLAGYAGNLALPRAGEVLRCTLIQRSRKIPVETSLGNVVAERVLDMVMLIVLTLIALLLEAERLSAFLGSLFVSKFAGAAFNSSIFIGIVLGGLLAGGLGLYGLYLFRNHKFVAGLWGFITRLWTGLIALKKVENLPLFILQTCLIWVGYYVSSAMVLYGFTPTLGLPIASALILNVVGAFGMVAPVQGGIGAYHYMVSAGMASIYGISLADGLALAFLIHTSQMIFTAIAGGAAFIWLSNHKPLASQQA